MRPFSLLLILLLGVGCGSDATPQEPGGSGRPPTPVTLQLDWFPNPDHVGIYTGIAKGQFAAEGLQVEPRRPSDVADPVKLVASGRADLGISYEPELLFAQQQDAPVVAVAAVVPTALNSIIARGDEGIETPADLRGRTIGEDGSESTAAYLDAVLREAGLDPGRDVDRVDVGFNLVPALLSRQVDAVIGVYQNIEGAQFEARGIEPVVFPVDEHGVPDYDELVLIAHRDRLAGDPVYRRTVTRFVRALGTATEYAKAHPDEAIDVMRAVASRDYKDVLERSVPATLKLLDTRPLDAAAWDAFGRWMYQQGLLENEPDGGALVAAWP